MSLVDMGKRLLQASRLGDVEEVRGLMANGAPFTTDWLGTSPLHFAANLGHVQTAEVLLRAGISRDARTKVDRTPLHIASQEGHTAIVDLLIQHGADVEAKDMLKMTPLHWSTERGHTAVVNILLQNNASISCEDKFDRTPLNIAMNNQFLDIVQAIEQAHPMACLQQQEERDTEQIESEIMTETVIHDHDELLGDTVTVSTSNNSSSTFPMSMANESISTAEEASTSTSVLDTLAALAEATASSSTATSSASEILAQHGIQVVSQDDQDITSAISEGSLTLTEAGKLALKLAKTGSGISSTNTARIVRIPKILKQKRDGKKIITVVPSSGGKRSSPTQSLNLHSELTEIPAEEVILDENSRPPATKKTRIEVDDGSTFEIEHVEDLSADDLKKQLEEIQRQANDYKKQLEQKEQEAEGYKKQLEIVITKHNSPSQS